MCSVSICVFRFWFYVWLKLISANTCVPRIFSLTVVRCLHGVWGAGIQPAEADYSIQLPGNPYPQCQAHHQTGGSVAPGMPSSSSDKSVSCYIIRQVSQWVREYQAHHQGNEFVITEITSSSWDRWVITGVIKIIIRWVRHQDHQTGQLLHECQVCAQTNKTFLSQECQWYHQTGESVVIGMSVCCYRNVCALLQKHQAHHHTGESVVTGMSGSLCMVMFYKLPSALSELILIKILQRILFSFALALLCLLL